MKKYLIVIVLVILSAIGIQADAQAPRRIVGTAGECDTTVVGCQLIPLTVTTLCTVSCTRLSAPSLTDSSRMWGNDTSNCRTSTDGGSTWGNCTTNPDASNLYNMAGAADGGVLAAGMSGGSCIIKRSTNNASTWTTVFSSTFGGLANCGTGGVVGGTRLKCAINGKCELTFTDVGNIAQTIQSTDSGVTWVATALTNVVYNPLSLSFDGTVGISNPDTPNGVNNYKAFVYSSSAWSLSVLWPSLTRCYPSMIINGTSYAVCQTGVTTVYTLRNTAGTLVNTWTLPGAFAGGTAGAIGTGWYTSNAAYTITNDDTSAGARIGVWVTREAFADQSLVRIFTGPASLAMTNQADIFSANGCIYFSAGSVTPIFAKIC